MSKIPLFASWNGKLLKSSAYSYRYYNRNDRCFQSLSSGVFQKLKLSEPKCVGIPLSINRNYVNSKVDLKFNQNQYSRTLFNHTTRNYCNVTGNSEFDLSYDEVMSMVKSGDIQLFDVRSHKEVEETGMMPDSIHLPLKEIPEAFQLAPGEFRTRYGTKMPDFDDSNIVMSCLGGIRSKKAMDLLHSYGYSRVRHFPGGWEEYEIKNPKQ
ncbi:Hsp67Bb [Bugula neritina]|uniref:Hsp67Bb n=1 Tax=Bugula neritina TaxID=10212 RepID=A0A7J7JFN3_BUGNE|nr:Hsp67Bb [Bugula neritina]